jgi:hypothetical protein
MTTRGMVAASVGLCQCGFSGVLGGGFLAFKGYVFGYVEDCVCGGDCEFCICASRGQHWVESSDAVADVEFSCSFCVFA